jgi:hypothetical protein
MHLSIALVWGRSRFLETERTDVLVRLSEVACGFQEL